MNPKVSIIIINWNGWEDTVECLESVNQINYTNYNIILVDNGSRDNSIKNIQNYCNGIKIESPFLKHDYHNKNIPIEFVIYDNYTNNFRLENYNLKNTNQNKIILIKNKENYGFTKGNNIGIDYAIRFLDPKYVLLLNNDTVVDKNFLNILVEYSEKNDKVGFSGPKIYFHDFKGETNIIQCAGTKQNLWWFNPSNIGIFEKDKGQYDEIKPIDFVQGSCILARVEMINEIGMFDEDFFSYREENDWGIRGNNQGWESVYVPKAVIWHKGGKSSGGHLSPLTIFLITRNDFLILKKHGNILQKIFLYINYIIFKFWFLLGMYLVYHHNFKAFQSFLLGLKEGILWKK